MTVSYHTRQRTSFNMIALKVHFMQSSCRLFTVSCSFQCLLISCLHCYFPPQIAIKKIKLHVFPSMIRMALAMGQTGTLKGAEMFAEYLPAFTAIPSNARTVDTPATWSVIPRVKLTSWRLASPCVLRRHEESIYHLL